MLVTPYMRIHFQLETKLFHRHKSGREVPGERKRVPLTWWVRRKWDAYGIFILLLCLWQTCGIPWGGCAEFKVREPLFPYKIEYASKHLRCCPTNLWHCSRLGFRHCFLIHNLIPHFAYNEGSDKYLIGIRSRNQCEVRPWPTVTSRNDMQVRSTLIFLYWASGMGLKVLSFVSYGNERIVGSFGNMVGRVHALHSCEYRLPILQKRAPQLLGLAR